MNFTDTIFTICKYDSVTLKADPTAVSYTWSSGDNAQFISASDSGKYSVIQTYQSGCKDTINYHVSLLEVPNLVVNSTVENQCKDSLKYFFADSGFIDYKWYHLPDSMLVCSSQTFSSNIDGSYYLVGISKTGCKIFSDQFSIKGLNIKNNLSLSTCDLQTIINFDSVSLLNHSNRKLYVKNNSDRIYFLKDLFLAHNVAFSIPESQFPKIIAPYDSVAIEVYYQPSVINSLERDTIILSDSCNHLSIPLVANSLKVEYRSPSSCDIPTNFNIGQYLSGLRLLVSVPYPNPATEAINFSIYNPDKEDISIEIFNIYNTSLLTVNKKSFRESALNQFKIDISILPSGVYYSNVKCNGNVVNFSFVVLK
ncbi:MAG: T9SS type A sorting domain-containing protein [Candidatus Kapabacteria bacterium]|nr:T9SS type A sorting domain-containing protein [Candidatus Kapabacteria bacterium]